jgi:hypothetical protein
MLNQGSNGIRGDQAIRTDHLLTAVTGISRPVRGLAILSEEASSVVRLTRSSIVNRLEHRA